MSAPYEIVVGCPTMYVATPGTTFPAIDAVPSGSWFKLGTSGSKNYDTGGVTVNQSQTLGTFTPGGGTAIRKVFRTDEGLTFGFSLVDLTPEQWAKIIDDVSVVTVAQSTGVAGNKAFEVMRGVQVKTFALLCRGLSPIDDSLASQFEVACCYQSGNPAPVLSKGGPAMLAAEYTALERTAGVLGTVRDQTTVAG